MPKLNRDGINISYEVHGGGPPLLLTHDFFLDIGDVAGPDRGAVEKSHTCVVGHAGHGQSDYPEDPTAYSEALTVADMAALLDTLPDSLVPERMVPS